MKRTTWKGKDIFINIPTILTQYASRQDRYYKCVNGDWRFCNVLNNVPTTIGKKNLIVLGILQQDKESGQWFGQPIKVTTIETGDNYAQKVLKGYKIKRLPY